jgi:hypothetical protein
VNCYPFIEAENAGDHNVKWACELLKVSRSAYYADRTNSPSQREQRDAKLTAKIVEIPDDSRYTYGSPRVHHELQAQGERCSRKRVARLMRVADRYGRRPGRMQRLRPRRSSHDSATRSTSLATPGQMRRCNSSSTGT